MITRTNSIRWWLCYRANYLLISFCVLFLSRHLTQVHEMTDKRFRKESSSPVNILVITCHGRKSLSGYQVFLHLSWEQEKERSKYSWTTGPSSPLLSFQATLGSLLSSHFMPLHGNCFAHRRLVPTKPMAAEKDKNQVSSLRRQHTGKSSIMRQHLSYD